MKFRSDSEYGAALVETAFLLPFLVLLLVGMVDVGRVLFLRTPLLEAAQEGANYASFYSSSYSDIQLRVIESIDSPNLTAAEVTVECIDDAPSDGTPDRVTVTVEHDIDLILPFMASFLGDPVTLTSSATGDLFVDPANCQPSP